LAIAFIPARKITTPPPNLMDDGPSANVIAFAAQHPVIVLIVFFALINAFTWYLFWVDKQRAIRRQWRVQESVLLFLAFLGGTIGAFAARNVFRHKTRKQPFVAHLYRILFFQIAGAVAVAIWLFRT